MNISLGTIAVIMLTGLFMLGFIPLAITERWFCILSACDWPAFASEIRRKYPQFDSHELAEDYLYVSFLKDTITELKSWLRTRITSVMLPIYAGICIMFLFNNLTLRLLAVVIGLLVAAGILLVNRRGYQEMLSQAWRCPRCGAELPTLKVAGGFMGTPALLAVITCPDCHGDLGSAPSTEGAQPALDMEELFGESSEEALMDKTMTGVVAYFTIIGWLFTWFAGDRQSARFHLDQSLVLNLLQLVIGLVSLLPALLPVLNDSVFSLALSAATLVVFVLSVTGMICAALDKEIPLPLVGDIHILK